MQPHSPDLTEQVRFSWCPAHLGVHRVDWCRAKGQVLMQGRGFEAALAEAHRRGFDIAHTPSRCIFCGSATVRDGHDWVDAVSRSALCPDAPYYRRRFHAEF